MNTKGFLKRILVAFLSLAITVTYMPASAFAEPITNQSETQSEAAEKSNAVAPEENTSEEKEVEEEAQKEQAESFNADVELDDVIIKAEAEAGVFPEGAILTAEKVTDKEAEDASYAVDEVRPDNLNVADSYTFDIKVVDEEGNELQPADGKKVNISFELDRAADKNLDADVYHIAEVETTDPKTKKTETVLEAEKLDSETDRKESTVTAETEGFSLYTVEFTYGELQYVMEGGSQDKASKIMKAVGLEGEIEDIRVSNEELFSASKESGEWTVSSHKAFDTEEWMKVTIGGIVYDIVVTDSEGDIEVNTWSGMKQAVNEIQDGKTIVLTADLTAGSDDSTIGVVRSSAGSSFTIDLAGHTIDRNLSSENKNNKGHVFDVNKGTVTIKDSSESKTGKITGGSDENGGAIVIGGEGTLNIEGVTISGNRATEDGGAIFVYGKLNMTGGEISGNTSKSAGGIAVHKSGTITLTDTMIQNNTASEWGGGGINNKGIATLTDCNISGNKAGNEGGGIYQGSNTLKLIGCTVTGNSAPGGGGICSFGTVTANDTNVTGNTASGDGGGVAVHGTFIMTGGSINNNKSEDGGGVYNKDGTIEFDGVTVSGNTTTKYGGAGINNKKNATLNNCVIKDNVGKASGGGVYSDKYITIKKCTITRNSAAGNGGGIHLENADLNLEDCTLKNNYAGNFGGGLSINGKTTNIKGTTVIEDNISYGTGGGIFVYHDATLNMEGDVRISGNSASYTAGGLGVGESKGNKINLKGKIFISENEGYGPNVYFRSKPNQYNDTIELSKLTLKEKLAEGSFIGLSVDYDIEGTSDALTSGYKEYYGNADPTLYFEGDNETAVQTNSDGEIVLHTSAWPTLQKLINEAANSGEKLILEKDWKCSIYDSTLTIPEGKTLNLDLNGHKIDRKLASKDQRDDGEIFSVESGRTLIIDDSTKKKTGKLIGGNGKNGGAISVKEGGVLELKGGNLTANKAEKGGAIYNEGTVKISGEGTVNAALYGNTAKLGGGIYNAGTLTIDCDAIRDNTASVGGGVYNAAGTMNLSGAISDNESDESAGGVYLADGSAFNVSGAASVKENISAAGENLLMAGGKTVVNIKGKLAAGTFFDVVAQNPDPEKDRKLTEGWEANKGGCSFSYSGKVYDSSATEGKLKEKDGNLWLKGINDTNIEWVSTWKELYDALRDENNSKVIALKNDIRPNRKKDDLCQLAVEKQKKTVDLCGFRLDSEGTIFKTPVVLQSYLYSSTLIKVGTIQPAELEIRDSVGTGMLTGGRATKDIAEEGSAIRISKGSKCKIIGCAISGNNTCKNGGGIFNAGELEMIGGSVTGNSAPKGSGGGIFNAGKMSLDGVTISENNAYRVGGGICMAGDGGDKPEDSQIMNCRIDNNKSQIAQGGGLYADIKGKTLTIEDSAIERNYVVHEEEIEWDSIMREYTYKMNNGGGIYLRAGTINMTGGSVSANTSENGAGISNGGARSVDLDETDGGGTININGTKIDGNKTVGQVITEDNKEKSFGGLGAGIYNTNKLKLEACTISNNKTAESGGGVWTSTDNTIEVTDCTFEGNQAEYVGGGVHLASGKLLIVGSNSAGTVFKDNEAYVDGGAVQVDGEIHVMGKVQVPNNAIFLPDGKKIKLDGALNPDSMIDVALAKNFGVFTDGYKTYHTDDEPERYFCSDYGYGVFKTADNEAELRLVIDDSSHFIDMYNQVNDVSKLTKANWMSGISGDRYLNEINLPCTHDSAMKEVNSNMMSSIGSFLGYEGNAQTQVRYIDEQMNDGVRRLDIRLNNRHEKSYALGLWISYKDDGKNLWLCHGKTFIGGTFWAGNHNGDDLTFNETWEWVKRFLELHPTETIILDLLAEPVSSWGHDVDDDTNTINERAKKLVMDFSKEINPSTGKPYVYWENGEVGKSMTRYPMLKECRGQAIFAGDCKVGGLDDFTMGNTVATAEPPGKHGESAADKIRHTYEFYKKDNVSRLQYIPTDVTEHLNLLYRVSALTAPLGVGGMPEDTPLNAANSIHQALYYSDNDDTGVFNQRGQYVGWIRQDGVTARLNHVVWISNFPEDDPDTPDKDESLQYCTVTAESGISDEEAVAAGLDPKKVKTQTYKLLKGTKFPIPGDIYGYNKELTGWNATPSGEENPGAANYKPGDTYRIMDNVTFKANWGVNAPQTPTEETKVKVVWIDRNNEDTIRPETITVNFKKSGTDETLVFPIGDAWETTIEGTVSEVTSVSDGGIRIKPTGEHPHGQDRKDEYAYSIINNKLTGCIIALYHTVGDSPAPEEDVLVTGSIAWDDNNDVERKRPESVVVYLMKDGEYTGIQNEISSATNWKWFFNLSSLGDYDPGASYSVSQDSVPYYTTEITGSAADGFIISNSLNAESHDWGEWETVTPATEESEGTEKRSCKNCGKVEIRTIPKDGKKMVNAKFEWTTSKPKTWKKSDPLPTNKFKITYNLEGESEKLYAYGTVTAVADPSDYQSVVGLTDLKFTFTASETDLAGYFSDGKGEKPLTAPTDEWIFKFKNGSSESTSGQDVDPSGDILIVGLEESYPWTGKQIKPAFKVYDNVNHRYLAQGVDYTVKYGKNKDAGTNVGTVTITGKGNYAKTGTPATFSIVKEEVPSDPAGQVNGFGKIAQQTYTGSPIYPETIEVKLKDKTVVTMKSNGDGTYSNSDTSSTKELLVVVTNNVNKGSATVAATGSNGVTKTTTFKINAKSMEGANATGTLGNPFEVTISDSADYKIKNTTPEVSIKYNGDELVAGQDYTAKFDSKKGKVTVTGKNNFTKKFVQEGITVNPLNLSDCKLVAVTAYEGVKTTAVKATVLDPDGNLVPAGKYTLDIKPDDDAVGSNGKLIGGKEIKVQAKANGKDSLITGTTAEEDFTVAKNFGKASIKVTGSVVYTGEAIELDDDWVNTNVTVKYSGSVIKCGDDFEIVGYTNNVKKGTMTVYAAGKGGFSGTKNFKVKITPKPLDTK